MSDRPNDANSHAPSVGTHAQAGAESRNEESATGKKPVSDRTLHLVRRRGFSKRSGRVLLISFAGLAFIAVTLALSSHPHGRRAGAKHSPPYSADVPSMLTAAPRDYAGWQRHGTFQSSEKPQPAGAKTPFIAAKSNGGAYPTYREVSPSASIHYPPPAPSAPAARAGYGEGGVGASISSRASAHSGADDAASSPLFFNVSLASSEKPSRAHRAAYTAVPAGAVNDSKYVKQNMAAEKKAFLASQRGDYGAYLNNRYLTPIDASHEIMAGTLIPITMVTGINSDLPGELIAQVNANVYDTITGTNILIPAGSRLLGRYDNSVAFGQNRVLVAWNRLIEPDGVSIELRGMPGTDLSGKSGFADKVDQHFGKLLKGVGLATVFNVATAAGVSALSSVKFLQEIGAAVVASGQTSTVSGSETQAIVEKYATKLLDQQPTIDIRAGYRGNVLVNEDMLLPAYPQTTIPAAFGG